MGFPLCCEFVRLWRNPRDAQSDRSADTKGCSTLGPTKPSSCTWERWTHLLLAPGSGVGHREGRQLHLLSTSHGLEGARGALPCQGRPGDAGEEACRASPSPTFAQCPHQVQRGAEGATQSWHSIRSRGCSLSPEMGTDPALAIRSCKLIWEELAPGSRQGSLAHSSPTLVPLGLCASCQT